MFRNINKDLSGELGLRNSIRQQILARNYDFHRAYAKEALAHEARFKNSRKYRKKEKYLSDSDVTYEFDRNSFRRKAFRDKQKPPRLIFPSGINDLLTG